MDLTLSADKIEQEAEESANEIPTMRQSYSYLDRRSQAEDLEAGSDSLDEGTPEQPEALTRVQTTQEPLRASAHI